MGKQINYWMDYDNFLLLAQKAIDLGCTIVKEDADLGKVIESKDICIVTPSYENFHNTRYVKKIAPYTEIVDVLISIKDENYGKEYEYRHKEYITKTCLDMMINEGYKLCCSL